MSREKLIKLEELEKLSPIKTERFEIGGDKKYLLVTKKDSEMPYEIYGDVLRKISEILSRKGIEGIIIDKSAFESLEIYELKTDKENLGDTYVTTNP